LDTIGKGEAEDRTEESARAVVKGLKVLVSREEVELADNLAELQADG
jgi:hypothetical protein